VAEGVARLDARRIQAYGLLELLASICARGAAHGMRGRHLKSVLVVAVSLVFATVGVCNLVLKASFTLMDDGVFWRQTPQGLVAARIAPGGPAARAGVRLGDVLVAASGEEALSPERLASLLAARRAGERATYTLLRESERRVLDVVVQPLPRGNVSAFYYLSLAGFFSLVVGTVVLLRRPPDRAALHFYAVCALFFLVYSISYTGSLTRFDCVTLVESCLAVARVAAAPGPPTWERFGAEVERMRYRGGVRRGYTSRLHYFSEWISDGESRGLVHDLGAELARRLRIDAAHTITGHTHRAGPEAGEAPWRIPGGGLLHNTGNWVFADAFHHPGKPPGPYWPGTVTWVEDEGPPRRERVLIDRPHAELAATVSRATRR